MQRTPCAWTVAIVYTLHAKQHVIRGTAWMVVSHQRRPVCQAAEKRGSLCQAGKMALTPKTKAPNSASLYSSNKKSNRKWKVRF